MISQNDKRLPKEIQNYGCLFMCLARTVKDDWTPEELTAKFNECKQAGQIGEKAYVKSYDECLRILGSKHRHDKRLSCDLAGLNKDFHIEKDKVYDEKILSIARFRVKIGSSNELTTHFIILETTLDMFNVEEISQVFYDPYAPLEATYNLCYVGIDRVDYLKEVN